MIRAVTAVVVLLALTGCGSSTPAKPNADCIPLSKAAIGQINDGTKTTAKLTKGEALKLPGDPVLPMFTYIVAAYVKDGSDYVEVFLTVDDPVAPGGIFAADNVAKVYFEWGEAATKGSPAADAAEAAWLSDTADEAKDCLNQ